MNQQTPRAAEQWFRKGTEAMNARQWDYAIEALSNAVRLSPETLLYRQVKYRCCRKRQKVSDGASGRASVKMVDIRRKLLQSQVQKDWAAVSRWAEEGVVLQPWDPQMFAHIAAAAVEQQHVDVARYTWSIALKLDRDNLAYNRACGRFLCGTADYDGAERCFRRILEQDPADRYAVEMIRYIDVERLINRGGYGQATSTRDVQVPDTAPAPDAASDDGHPPAPDRGGVFDLSKNGGAAPAATRSARLANHLKLGTQYAEQRCWQMCMDQYRHALALAPDDFTIRERMNDAELRLLKENMEKLQRAARKPGDSQRLAEEAAQAEYRLIVRRIQMNTERAKRLREDMSLCFELAEDYSRLGRYRQAIPLYQQACRNLKLREEALLRLGQCWICDGKRDLACRQFDLALKSLSAAKNPDGWKTAHYWLGRLNESEGRPEVAESHYAEVLLLDYDFRDTARRLELLQNAAASAGQHR
ncbi:MAG: hypothetical protein RIK87_29470 [Fuerstiella sp.]